MMQRVPEPELMDDAAQARAYAEADFAEAHDAFVRLYLERFGAAPDGWVLDLGCGPGDVTLRFARACPQVRVHGVDGAAAMLRLGTAAVEAAGLGERVTLLQGHLPGASLPRPRYDAVISNSLLHHLAEPGVLWASARRFGAPGAPLFVMDLLRPADPAELEALVARYAADAPPVLRRDFAASLAAAYRVDEVRAQLAAAGLAGFTVEAVSDRHWVAWGRLPEAAS
ncbi:class I SAM-dependent methyltransferase [Ectothiorhodospiraceae bacterium 2226]|nr:class I SAM-dependent methyltransferase [Ectothiorhodospiraceae bacterium 2226]